MFKLRFRVPGNAKPLELDFEESTTLDALNHLLQEPLDRIVDEFELRHGVPPKKVDLKSEKLLQSIFKFNELLTVVFIGKETGNSVAVQSKGKLDGVYIPKMTYFNTLIIRKMPADNSCMFHAFAYVFDNKSRVLGLSYRNIIADGIQENPLWLQPYLSEPLPQYVNSLRRKNTWGGGIELEFMARTKKVVIHALDTQSSVHLKFGEGQGYTTAVFLLYTGNHYDALVAIPPMGNTKTSSTDCEDRDQVIFNSSDDKMIQAAKDFIRNHSK